MYRSLLSLVVHSNMEPKLLTCEKDLSQKLKYVDVFWEDTTLEFDVWKCLNYVDVCQVVHQITEYAKTPTIPTPISCH